MLPEADARREGELFPRRSPKFANLQQARSPFGHGRARARGHPIREPSPTTASTGIPVPASQARLAASITKCTSLDAKHPTGVGQLLEEWSKGGLPACLGSIVPFLLQSLSRRSALSRKRQPRPGSLARLVAARPPRTRVDCEDPCAKARHWLLRRAGQPVRFASARRQHHQAARAAPVPHTLEAEPHLCAGFDMPGKGPDKHGSGFGPGFRGTIELVDNGFVKSINNSVGLGFGLDWLSPGDRNVFWVPVVMQWNFWLRTDGACSASPAAAATFKP